MTQKPRSQGAKEPRSQGAEKPRSRESEKKNGERKAITFHRIFKNSWLLGSLASRLLGFLTIITLSLILSVAGLCAVKNSNGGQTMDAVVKEAAQVLRDGPPKKLKTRGKPKVVRWDELDAALAKLPARIDYEGMIARLRDLLSKDTGFAPDAETLTQIMDRTLAQQEVPYTALFTLEDADLVPITNTVLKYLPEEAWKDVPVYNKKGEALGSFVGKFPYEKSGGLLVNKSYRVYYFQYRDKNDTNQTATAPDYIERDEFCVKWGDIKSRPALTLATLKP